MVWFDEEATMKYLSPKITEVCAVVVFLGAAAAPALKARQAPSVKRNILLKQDMGIPDREAVMASVELPPGSAEGRHTHSAEVYAFVLEGTISLENEGKPTVTLKAGDVFTIGSGRVLRQPTMETERRKWRWCSLPKEA